MHLLQTSDSSSIVSCNPEESYYQLLSFTEVSNLELLAMGNNIMIIKETSIVEN